VYSYPDVSKGKLQVIAYIGIRPHSAVTALLESATPCLRSLHFQQVLPEFTIERDEGMESALGLRLLWSQIRLAQIAFLDRIAVICRVRSCVTDYGTLFTTVRYSLRYIIHYGDSVTMELSQNSCDGRTYSQYSISLNPH